MFNLDPRIGMAVNALLLFVMALGSGTIVPPPGVSPEIAAHVVAWCGWIGVVVNFFAHAFSSQSPGPLNMISPPSKLNSPWLAGALAIAFAAVATLGGCANLSQTQRENLQLQLALAKQIGIDTVQIWCATSGIIYVIAKDVSAESRVTTAIGKNNQAATDACPMIAQVTGITVTTAANAPAVAIAK